MCECLGTAFQHLVCIGKLISLFYGDFDSYQVNLVAMSHGAPAGSQVVAFVW
jgi:hypothetical protein